MSDPLGLPGTDSQQESQIRSLVLQHYRSEIYAILQHMHRKISFTTPPVRSQHSDRPLSENVSLISSYLQHNTILRLDLLLRSFKAFELEVQLNDDRILRAAQTKLVSVENRVRAWLAERNYVLSGPDDVQRLLDATKDSEQGAELHEVLYPLIYLLLERHLAIMNLGSRYLLHAHELEVQSRSLTHLSDYVDEYVHKLKAAFEQNGAGIQTQFSNFAHGMFLETYLEEIYPSGNNKWSILTFKEASPLAATLSSPQVDAEAEGDVNILTHPIADRPTILSLSQDHLLLGMKRIGVGFLGDIDNDNNTTTSPHNIRTQTTTSRSPLSTVLDAFCGYWSGSCRIPDADDETVCVYRFWHYAVEPGDEPMSFKGRGEVHFGVVDVSGKIEVESGGVQQRDQGEYPISIDILPIDDTGYFGLRCRGVYDLRKDQISGTWEFIGSKSGGDQEEDDGEGSAMDQSPDGMEKGTFFASRTPAVFQRFRQLLVPNPDSVDSGEHGSDVEMRAEHPPQHDTKDSDPLKHAHTLARRRWTFACQAVRYFVQSKLFSKQFVLERMKERRRWIEIDMQAKWADKLGIRAKDTQLTQEMWDEFDALGNVVSPSNARLYDATADWFVERGVKNVGTTYCDVCGGTILTVVRHHCIECVSEDFGNQVDLCLLCLDDDYERVPDPEDDDDFPVHHLQTHTLIRSRRVIPRYEYKSVLLQARRRLEAKRDQLKCASCRSLEISASFWVCLDCEPETVICNTCDGSQTPLQPSHSYSIHSTQHNMLWIKT